MAQHALLHFSDYELAAFDVLMSPSHIFFEPLYLAALLILVRLQLVLLLDEGVTVLAHLIKFITCLLFRLVTLSYRRSFLFVGSLDLG